MQYLDEELSSLVSETKEFDSTPTTAFQRVIQRAAIHVQSSGRSEVTGANVLVAIFAERESNAAYFLQEQEMTRYDAVNYIAHGVAKDPSYSEKRAVTGANEPEGQIEDQENNGETTESALSKYCIDLNQNLLCNLIFYNLNLEKFLPVNTMPSLRSKATTPIH